MITKDELIRFIEDNYPDCAIMYNMKIDVKKKKFGGVTKGKPIWVVDNVINLGYSINPREW